MAIEIFKNAKVKDRVWDFICGYGTIEFISNTSSYPIHVLFDLKYRDEDITKNYTIEGKVSRIANQTLFWQEFKIPTEAYLKQ